MIEFIKITYRDGIFIADFDRNCIRTALITFTIFKNLNLIYNI